MAADRIAAVGLALFDLRCPERNRGSLEHRQRMLVGGVDATGGGIAHAAYHGTGFVGNDVTEQVVGQNHVETGRVGYHEDGGRVDVQIVVETSGYLRHRIDDALPCRPR